MRQLTKVYSHQCLEDKWKSRKVMRYSVYHDDVVTSEALPVQSFAKLVEAAAHVSYFNRGFNIFFRGQGKDHLNSQKANTFYPSLFRGRMSQENLDRRFVVLERASALLVSALDGMPVTEKLPGSHLVRRYPELSWAILQHYEVCPTPLMDFTHSLRVAASFALDGHSRSEGYVYLFGFPSLPDGISYHVNEEMMIIRLLSFCPPDARRPYFQEGYVAGHFPNFDTRTKKVELDFKNRLVAKFKLENADGNFWGDDFKEIPKVALFPNHEDRFYEMCNNITLELEKEFGTNFWR